MHIVPSWSINDTFFTARLSAPKAGFFFCAHFICRLFQDDGFILIFKPNPYHFTMAKWFGLFLVELAEAWSSKLRIVAKNVNKFNEWISITNVRINNNNNKNNHLNGKRNEIESHVTMATSYCIWNWNMDSIIIIIIMLGVECCLHAYF